MPGPILAAVDGSQPSLHAVDWAAEESALRQVPLQITHVALKWSYQAPATPDEAGAGPGAAGEAPDEAGLRLLDAAAQRATDRSPGIDVETRMLVGSAAAMLLSEAENACLVVLGRRGATGFAGHLLGSISHQVAAHAKCPVAVIPDRADAGWDQAARGAHPEQEEIVLGVDGAKKAAESVAFAFREAALRGVRLRAIHSWTHALTAGAGGLLPVHDADTMAAEGARLLAASVAGWRERFRDVRVTEQVERGHAAKILADASAKAGLLVVGAQGQGGFPGLTLGSVTHGVLHHARCPVVVVHPLR
jgi:nucleotide-binding universal stress UspA family protein